MDETIRDRLKRRIRRCMAIGLAAWFLPPFSMGVIGGLVAPAHIDSHTAGAIYLTGLLVFGGAVLVAGRTLCPACSERIGKMIGMSVAFPFLKKPANFCPYCGVHLDQAAPMKSIS